MVSFVRKLRRFRFELVVRMTVTYSHRYALQDASIQGEQGNDEGGEEPYHADTMHQFLFVTVRL